MYCGTKTLELCLELFLQVNSVERNAQEQFEVLGSLLRDRGEKVVEISEPFGGVQLYGRGRHRGSRVSMAWAILQRNVDQQQKGQTTMTAAYLPVSLQA
jgi:hypothetical protein